MKKTSKLLALALAGAMMLGLTACGGTAGAGSAANSSAPAASEPAAAAGSAAASDKAYNIGICQLVQHEALDAATKGFKDALTEKLGDKVTFDEQNASRRLRHLRHHLQPVRLQQRGPDHGQRHPCAPGRYRCH